MNPHIVGAIPEELIYINAMPAKKARNFIKSIPTRARARARREYMSNTYTMKRVGGSQPVRVRRTNPITYNKASTGIRKRK